MEAIQPWYLRPVFLSSTFKEMHAVRDHLRQHVFPKVAADFRWLPRIWPGNARLIASRSPIGRSWRKASYPAPIVRA